MQSDSQFRKNLTAAEITALFQQALEEVHRPANERILTDHELCRMLNVSKRLTASWRADGLITFHKVRGVVFYLLSDVLQMIASHRIESIDANIKIH